MFWHDTVLVNGFEYSAYWASQITRRRYILKIVGDTAWEEARGSGLTVLDIDDFQKEEISGRAKRFRVWREKYLQGASKIITPSEYLKMLVAKWNVPLNKIQVIYNGVIPNTQIDTIQKRNLKKPLRIIFIGRLTNWKGVETLLLAVKDIENIEVYIAGDGPELTMLVLLSQQLQLGKKVKFLGNQDHQTLTKILAEMHTLVLGSSYEGLSHTLLEACSIGLPCITSNAGGNPEIIKHGENGLLFPYGNVQALIQCIKTLQNDENIRIHLALNAKETAKKFNFHETVQQTIQSLLEIR